MFVRARLDPNRKIKYIFASESGLLTDCRSSWSIKMELSSPLSICLQIWTAFVCAPDGGVLLQQNSGEPPISPSIISRYIFRLL